jgi:hypothetical protein
VWPQQYLFIHASTEVDRSLLQKPNQSRLANNQTAQLAMLIPENQKNPLVVLQG